MLIRKMTQDTVRGGWLKNKSVFSVIEIMNGCHRLPGEVSESLTLSISKKRIALHSIKNGKSIRNDIGKCSYPVLGDLLKFLAIL